MSRPGANNSTQAQSVEIQFDRVHALAAAYLKVLCWSKKKTSRDEMTTYRLSPMVNIYTQQPTRLYYECKYYTQQYTNTHNMSYTPASVVTRTQRQSRIGYAKMRVEFMS